MRIDLYEEMYRQESTHWWHITKRRIVQDLIKRKVPNLHAASYLDAGCGTGAMMQEMQPLVKRVSGVDGSPESLKFTKKRGFPHVKLVDLEKSLPYPAETFDVITCLDVAEHVKGDERLFLQLKKILKKEGKIFFTVPAYQFLWSYWDDVLGHYRRYTISELTHKLEKAGFKVQMSSHIFSYLLLAVPLRYVKELFGKKSSDFVALPRVMNTFMTKLGQIELCVLRFIAIPIGLSIVVEAQA